MKAKENVDMAAVLLCLVLVTLIEPSNYSKIIV
jgi:hypothetical protein